MANKVILIGRTTKEPETRQAGETQISTYTLAVDRKFKKEGQPDADFIRCTAFGRNSDFAEKYLRKGTKILVIGRIQTGSYTDKDGKTIYTTDVIVEEHEFVESKKAQEERNVEENAADGFLPLPDDIDESKLPFA